MSTTVKERFLKQKQGVATCTEADVSPSIKTKMPENALFLWENANFEHQHLWKLLTWTMTQAYVLPEPALQKLEILPRLNP